MGKYVIITGDLVNSRGIDSKLWLNVLVYTLTKCSKKFDIFRGDSFQAELTIENCLEAVFYIKAKIKSLPDLDVRIGLGMGSIDYSDEHTKNSTGEAFVYSGQAFDDLHKELFLVHSALEQWDLLTNTMLNIAMELANKWTVNMAETVAAYIEHPTLNQQELAQMLNRKYQSQISTELGKANWLKIKRAVDYCQNELVKAW